MSHLGEKESLDSLLARHEVAQEIRTSVKTIGFSELFGWHNCISREELEAWFLEGSSYAPSKRNDDGGILDLRQEGSWDFCLCPHRSGRGTGSLRSARWC